MNHLRTLLLSLLALSLIGCVARRGGGGGGDDDDDGPSDDGHVSGQIEGLTFPTLSAVYIEEMLEDTISRMVVASDGLTCADYQDYWDAFLPQYREFLETGATEAFQQAANDAVVDLPGMPGWLVNINFLSATISVDEPLEPDMVSVTANEFEEGESPSEDLPFPIAHQVGLSVTEGSLTAFGEQVAGTVSGTADYVQNYIPGEPSTSQQREASFTFDAQRCDLEDLEIPDS